MKKRMKITLIIIGILILFRFLGKEDMKESKEIVDNKTKFLNSFDFSITEEQQKRIQEEGKNINTDLNYTFKCIENCKYGEFEIIIDKNEDISTAGDSTNRIFLQEISKNIEGNPTMISHIRYDGAEFSLCVGPINGSVKCYK